MKPRFKLRAALLATALVGLFLGLQVHVHNKAKKFVKEMKAKKDLEYRVNQSIVLPPTMYDLMFFQRRCETTVSATISETVDSSRDQSITAVASRYKILTQIDRVGLVGVPDTVD